MNVSFCWQSAGSYDVTEFLGLPSKSNFGVEGITITAAAGWKPKQKGLTIICSILCSS